MTPVQACPSHVTREAGATTLMAWGRVVSPDLGCICLPRIMARPPGPELDAQAPAEAASGSALGFVTTSGGEGAALLGGDAGAGTRRPGRKPQAVTVSASVRKVGTATPVHLRPL